MFVAAAAVTAAAPPPLLLVMSARALALRSHGHLHHDTFNKTHLRRRRRRVAAAAAALDIVSRSVPIPQSKELSVVNPFAILFSRK